MTTTTRREIAIRAVRAQLRALGIDPVTATAYDVEAVISDMPAATLAGAFYRDASDNQWRLFLREFRAWQRREARRRGDDATMNATTLTATPAVRVSADPNDTVWRGADGSYYVGEFSGEEGQDMLERDFELTDDGAIWAWLWDAMGVSDDGQ